MGFLSKFIGATTAQPIEAIGNVIGKVFEGKDKALTHQEIMTELAMRPEIAQTEINKLEAQHRSIFVAGWRPFIGWICGCGLAFVFIVNPIVQWLTSRPGPDMPTAALMSLVTSLLGLGLMRTAEKVAGAAK